MTSKSCNVNIISLSLQIDENLIIGDLHLGYEDALINEGIFIPKLQYKKIVNHLKKIFEIANSYCKIERVIICGDLKHEFGRITKQESKEVSNILNFLKEYVKEIVLVRGNHDNFLKGKFDQLISFCEHFVIKNFLIIHGDKIPNNFKDITKNIDTIIIGHEHPCIGLRTLERNEKIKCFLKGKFMDKNLIVIPSFNFITEGTDITQENLLSPFLKDNDLLDFEVYGVENFEIFYFGKVKNLM